MKKSTQGHRVYSASSILAGAIYDAQLRLNQDDSKEALNVLQQRIKRLVGLEKSSYSKVKW